MIRSINGEDAGAGPHEPGRAEPDPEPAGEIAPEAEVRRLDDDDEELDPASGEEELEFEDPEGEGSGDPFADGDDGDQDDVVDRETVGLEAVGLDAVDGPRPRSAAAAMADLDAPGAEPVARPHDAAELKGAVEAILFSMSEPIGIRALSDLVGAGVHEVRAAVEELRYEYVDSQRAFRLEEIAGGVQLLTQSRYDRWISRLRQKEKESRLSAAALETLSVVAYKQPITKADLEGIRGVGCSQILKTLMDRGLLEVVGRDEGLGKPLLYGTTKRFLESFGLESVGELPRPEEVATPDDDGLAE